MTRMELLDLPVELRLQIFEHLEDLSPGRHETIGPHVRLTPAICRTNSLLREETLPAYVRNSCFVIYLQPQDLLQTPPPKQQQEQQKNILPDHENTGAITTSRISAWLAALGPDGLAHVRSFQLSRDWMLRLPARWEGHIGFYVRLLRRDERGTATWCCEAGTYPIANEKRGLRKESVEMLKAVVTQRMTGRTSSTDELLLSEGEKKKEARVLTREDVEFIVRAMDVVATHPIPSLYPTNSETGVFKRSEVWTAMEKGLQALGD